MKLWLLKPVAKNLRGGPLTDPWEPWRAQCRRYDTAFGFVVRAESEEAARTHVADSHRTGVEGATSWLDPRWSTCKELSNEGEPIIILRDFRTS